MSLFEFIIAIVLSIGVGGVLGFNITYSVMKRKAVNADVGRYVIDGKSGEWNFNLGCAEKCCKDKE